MNSESKLIKSKLGLLQLAEQLGNVSTACKYLGYSRDTFYRYKELFEQGGEAGLKELSRKKPNIKNRIAADIEERVVSFAIENPAFGQTRASNELRKSGVFISPAGVRCAWQRHDLETFKKRLKALDG
ncbi:winged helix-turn helix [Bacteroidales bacterium 6E]|nr:winged helix-turn helix [Bacteroidales bacterium 6E]